MPTGRRIVIASYDVPSGAMLERGLIDRGARVVARAVDEDPERLIAVAAEHLGGVDALIVAPCAAASEDVALDGLSLESWHAGVTKPLRATIRVVRHALAHWLEEGAEGDLVLVHSPGTSGPGEALHTALVAFSRSVAKEYGRRRVRCNLVTRAPLADDPRVIAAIGFALSPAASFVTGQELFVAASASRVAR